MSRDCVGQILPQAPVIDVSKNNPRLENIINYTHTQTGSESILDNLWLIIADFTPHPTLWTYSSSCVQTPYWINSHQHRHTNTSTHSSCSALSSFRSWLLSSVGLSVVCSPRLQTKGGKNSRNWSFQRVFFFLFICSGLGVKETGPKVTEGPTFKC